MAVEYKTAHLHARLTPSARQVIEKAADVAGMHMSTWVARVALAEAQRELQKELERMHQASLQEAR